MKELALGQNMNEENSYLEIQTAALLWLSNHGMFQWRASDSTSVCAVYN